MATARPTLPQPEPVTVETKKSALLVLDLSEACADPKTVFHRLVPAITKFLARARAAGLFTVFTVSASLEGTPMGQVYSGFQRQPSEPVIFPDGFDKFVDGQLQKLLKQQGVDTLVITGGRSNIAVLYTATRAARNFNYRVIIPVDGMVAGTDYEQEYTLYQFSVLPAGAAERFSFTTLDMLRFH